MSRPRLSTPQTLDQKRASDAWAVVDRVARGDERARRQFGMQVKRMPARIMTSGLGQALAFLEAKDYAPDLRDALAEWIHRCRFRESAPTGPATAATTTPTSAPRLLERLIHGDADFQRFATTECLAYLTWLVRFCDARQLIDSTD